jgi:hypothetical protein
MTAPTLTLRQVGRGEASLGGGGSRGGAAGIGIDQVRHRWRARPLLNRGHVADHVHHRLREDVAAALSLREGIAVALCPASNSRRGRWIWPTVRPQQDLAVVAPEAVRLDDDDGDRAATTVTY